MEFFNLEEHEMEFKTYMILAVCLYFFVFLIFRIEILINLSKKKGYIFTLSKKISKKLDEYEIQSIRNVTEKLAFKYVLAVCDIRFYDKHTTIKSCIAELDKMHTNLMNINYALSIYISIHKQLTGMKEIDPEVITDAIPEYSTHLENAKKMQQRALRIISNFDKRRKLDELELIKESIIKEANYLRLDIYFGQFKTAS